MNMKANCDSIEMEKEQLQPVGAEARTQIRGGIFYRR